MNFLCVGLLCLFMSFIKSQKHLFFLLFIIFIFQTIQINHWVYFGIPIHADDLTKIFVEVDEILLTGTSCFYRMWPAWFSIATTALMQIGILKYLPHRIVIKKIHYVLYLCLAIFPSLIAIQGNHSFPLYPQSISLLHTYRSLAVWSIFSWQQPDLPAYKPYTYSKENKGYPNIIFIMGESTNTRYSSLYGYNEKTTPFMDSLDSQHFSFAKGLSSSTSTKTSLPLFFNVVREPQHLDLIHQKTVNLFKLAKEQGYQTVYITGQNPKLFYNCGTEYIDQLIDLQQQVNTDLKADHVLIDALKNIPLKKQNFIVVHLRHIHSPYDMYMHNKIFSQGSPEQNLYAHAIYWHDDWVKQFLQTVDQIFPKKTLTIFTSDHGELLGEHGLYGHTILEPLVADVPVWCYAKNDNPFILSWIKQQTTISHYELGVQIAKLMGINIHNPQDNGITYYVHGANLYSQDFRFLTYQKTHSSVTFCKNEKE